MDTLLNPARNEGETFEDYKARRRAVNTAIKQHLKGRPFHATAWRVYRHRPRRAAH